ncbi:g4153 [Coccomyxa elongata]
MCDVEKVNVIIIGGSVGGLACAHALLKSGRNNVTVFERASAINAAGAGLGLGVEALAVLQSFGLEDELRTVSQPMPIEINRAVAPNGHVRQLYEDRAYNHRSLHWSDLHKALLAALPHGIVNFGTTVTAVEQKGGSKRAVVWAEKKGAATDSDGMHPIRMECDLVVAADGSMSDTRRRFRPDESRRYSGYCAWRGVVTDEEAPDAAHAVRRAYPEVGKALYFDLAQGTHAVLYDLPGKRLNWLWYINQPEPGLKGHSVTVKADDRKIAEMHEQAAATFTPELAALMQATKAPFINAIYDREPQDQWVFGRIVLVGEAAHPTTPHGLRSTNMAICDAGALGTCLAEESGDIGAALDKFQQHRIKCTAREVLFSRHLGRIKQSLDCKHDWFAADEILCKSLGQSNMADFLV